MHAADDGDTLAARMDAMGVMMAGVPGERDGGDGERGEGEG